MAGGRERFLQQGSGSIELGHRANQERAGPLPLHRSDEEREPEAGGQREGVSEVPVRFLVWLAILIGRPPSPSTRSGPSTRSSNTP